MARNNDRDRDRGPKRVVKDSRLRGKKRVCIFCQEKVAWVDYKDVNLLRRFMSDRGKIRSRRVTGNCAQHQREVQVAMKTAREVALLPYAQRTLTERAPGRAPRESRENQAVQGRAETDGDFEEIGELDGFEGRPDVREGELDYVDEVDEPAAVRQLQESEV
jgi:small subunit ribosomal protein S18